MPMIEVTDDEMLEIEAGRRRRGITPAGYEWWCPHCGTGEDEHGNPSCWMYDDVCENGECMKLRPLHKQD